MRVLRRLNYYKKETMTLLQVFTEWAAMPQNATQAARNRTAVDSLLMKGLGQKDVRELTAFVVRKHFASIADSCDEIKKRKVRTASILVQVLKYAAGKKECIMPDFDYSIASTKDSEINSSTPSSQKALGGKGSGAAIASDPSEPAPFRLSLDVSGDGVDVEAQSQTRDEFGMFTKGSEPWNKGKHPGVFGGRKKVPVVQLHPDTLEVVARFECMADAKRETKVSNIGRSLKDHKLSGGYYWCHEGEENGFKPDYKTGPQRKAWSRKKKECPKGCRKPAAEKSLSGCGRTAGKSVSVGGGRNCPPHISSFSDEQLKDELVRRGWTGTLHKQLVL